MRASTQAQACVLAVAWLMIESGVTHGATYFTAKSGHDAADGLSPTTAFASIGKGVSVLKPGDTLSVLPGEYFESVNARVSGRPDAPITIRARYPGSVLLRGDVDVAGFKRARDMRHTYALDFKRRVEGVAERSTFQIYRYQPSVAEVGRNNGSFYQDEEAGRLYVHTADSQDPEQHVLSVSVTRTHGFLLRGNTKKWLSDVVIEGLSFTGYQVRDYPRGGPGNNMWLGLCIEFAERITVRHCAAYLNSGGIWMSLCLDSVVEDCRSFGNRSYHYPLGKNILGWAVHNTTFRRNVVEGFTRDSMTSSDDIAFYGGQAVVGPFAYKRGKVFMLHNKAINAGIMIKGAYSADSEQHGNVAFGHGAYFYRKAGTMNVLTPARGDVLARDYVDPIAHDYRLQSDSKLRGTGVDGSDPGPYPYRDEVYFVSPSGDDGAAGTSVKTAWRTLAYAARKAQPGHTVYVMAGEYREPLAPAQSGTVDSPIRFLRRGLDRVVIEGEGRLSVGIDLSGRSNIICRGFMVIDCTKAGAVASQGQNLSIEKTIILNSGGQGIVAADGGNLRVEHNLVRRSKGYGISQENVTSGTVVGNILDGNARGGVKWDAQSARGIWVDYNAYCQDGVALCALEERTFRDLTTWTRETGNDRHSLTGEPGFRDAERGDFSLTAGSPLIGRGALGSAIGPYFRHVRKAPLRVHDVGIRAITDTAATVTYSTLRYQQPGPSFWERRESRTQGVTIEWGPSPACGNKFVVPSEWQTTHTVGLVGLKPRTRYHYRVTSTAQTGETVFVPFLLVKEAEEAAPAVTGTFETIAQSPAPRVFHVAKTGDDANDGLSAGRAWATVGHAASQARPGDTILIHEGTYEEHVVVEATGSRNAPITFRAAPGETVWMSGSKRRRVFAFQLVTKHHIIIDGLRFREFNHQSHNDGCILIVEGSGHTVRRCLQDGRNLSGYTGCFVRASNASGLLIENCVTTLSMGEGLSLWECPDTVVRHCVFYNNMIRSMSCSLRNPESKVTLSHNLFCDSSPNKTSVPILRLGDLSNLRSDHNGYFTRTGAGQRKVVETTALSGQAEREKLTLAEVQKRTSQGSGSIFGNPGMKIASELVPSKSPKGEWRKAELRWNGTEFLPFAPSDFFAEPAGPFARSAAGKPIGLDPDAFR